MNTLVRKVAPPNARTSAYPRITHKIAMAGGKDFHDAKVEFGLQIRPADSLYPAIRVNTQFWKLRYRVKEDHRVIRLMDYRGEYDHLSERLADWIAKDRDRREANPQPVFHGISISQDLPGPPHNRPLYWFWRAMATAIVRLFVSRRAVIGTRADFTARHEADKYFDEHYDSLHVIPLEGIFEVPGMAWLENSIPIPLDELTKPKPKRVAAGDWIYFDHHDIFDVEDPFGGENALWLGGGMLYAHDYGLLSTNDYLKAVCEHGSKPSLATVKSKSKATLQLVSK
jgi:hypothetical protein